MLQISPQFIFPFNCFFFFFVLKLPYRSLTAFCVAIFFPLFLHDFCFHSLVWKDISHFKIVQPFIYIFPLLLFFLFLKSLMLWRFNVSGSTWGQELTLLRPWVLCEALPRPAPCSPHPQGISPTGRGSSFVMSHHFLSVSNLTLVKGLILSHLDSWNSHPIFLSWILPRCCPGYCSVWTRQGPHCLWIK